MKQELEELRKELNARIDKLLGKDKFIVGDWYIGKCGSIINYQGRERGYGFNAFGDWTKYKWTFIENPEDWSPCPIEKVKSALKKEAEKRGYKEGVMIESFFGGLSGFSDDQLGPYLSVLDRFWYKGSAVMQAGKWAKIIPKEDDIFIGNYKVEFTEGGVIIKDIHLSKQFLRDASYVIESGKGSISLDFGKEEQLTCRTVNKILDRLNK